MSSVLQLTKHHDCFRCCIGVTIYAQMTVLVSLKWKCKHWERKRSGFEAYSIAVDRQGYPRSGHGQGICGWEPTPGAHVQASCQLFHYVDCICVRFTEKSNLQDLTASNLNVGIRVQE